MAEYHHRMVKRYIFEILYEMATAISQDILSLKIDAPAEGTFRGG